jgi:hypothetical protein
VILKNASTLRPKSARPYKANCRAHQGRTITLRSVYAHTVSAQYLRRHASNLPDAKFAVQVDPGRERPWTGFLGRRHTRARAVGNEARDRLIHRTQVRQHFRARRERAFSRQGWVGGLMVAAAALYVRLLRSALVAATSAARFVVRLLATAATGGAATGDRLRRGATGRGLNGGQTTEHHAAHGQCRGDHPRRNRETFMHARQTDASTD